MWIAQLSPILWFLDELEYIQQNIAVRLWKLPLLFAPETKYLSFNHFVWIGERESAMKYVCMYVCMEFMLITQSVGMGILQPV